jgi:hypothetical protein
MAMRRIHHYVSSVRRSLDETLSPIHPSRVDPWSIEEIHARPFLSSYPEAQAALCKQGVNRWTDNIFSIKVQRVPEGGGETLSCHD